MAVPSAPDLTADMVGSLLLRQGLGLGQAATGHQGGASGQRMDPDRVDADFRDTPPTLYKWLRKGDMRARQAPRVSPCVVDLGRRERASKLARARYAPRPQRWPAPMRTVGRKSLDKAPPALSHDGNGQEAAHRPAADRVEDDMVSCWRSTSQKAVALGRYARSWRNGWRQRGQRLHREPQRLYRQVFYNLSPLNCGAVRGYQRLGPAVGSSSGGDKTQLLTD